LNFIKIKIAISKIFILKAESPDVGENANEWVAESEATLDALFNANGTNPSNGNFAFTGQNIYSASGANSY
jgi:hypothetical protein